MNYNKLMRDVLDEIYKAGLVNAAFGREPWVLMMEALLKTGRKIQNKHEMLLLLDAFQLHGIYRDWFLGHWKPNAGLVWWKEGDITKCSHADKKHQLKTKDGFKPAPPRCKCAKLQVSYAD